MKFINRVKNLSSSLILAKIQVKHISKTENNFLLECLTKDGSFIREYKEEMNLSETKKLIEIFSGKMKKCAWLTHTNIGENGEYETILLMNPELMEKERVGFEMYGPISDRYSNADIIAYYSFTDTDSDRRQVINNADIYGFFRLSNFESDGGFKATLNEIGITYTLIDKTVNNYIFMSLAEFKRQFGKDETLEPKKTFKNKSTLPKEIKAVIDAVKKTENSKEEISEIVNTSVKSDEAEPVKRRGRPAKQKEPEKVEEKLVETAPLKRGRGRPPKVVKENS